MKSKIINRVRAREAHYAKAKIENAELERLWIETKLRMRLQEMAAGQRPFVNWPIPPDKPWYQFWR